MSTLWFSTFGWGMYSWIARQLSFCSAIWLFYLCQNVCTAIRTLLGNFAVLLGNCKIQTMKKPKTRKTKMITSLPQRFLKYFHGRHWWPQWKKFHRSLFWSDFIFKGLESYFESWIAGLTSYPLRMSGFRTFSWSKYRLNFKIAE